jgi:hypothetical protein
LVSACRTSGSSSSEDRCCAMYCTCRQHADGQCWLFSIRARGPQHLGLCLAEGLNMQQLCWSAITKAASEPVQMGSESRGCRTCSRLLTPSDCSALQW